MGLLDVLSRGTGALAGSTGNYGGLLDDAQVSDINKQRQMALAAALLDAGGWSPQRTSIGQALGRGMSAANQAGGAGVEQALQAVLLKKQMQGQKSSPFGNINPKEYTPESVAKFEETGKYADLVPVAKAGDGVGQYQPGDYTAQSWAKFAANNFNDPSVLERYVTPRQEYSPSFQNVTKTLADGSTQQGTFDTRTGAYDWKGEIVPPGKKAEADAAGGERGKITGAREGKAPVAYATFKTGIANLENAMSKTQTDPFSGRMPALTAAQQTAEGAEAIMAPVLKQLFRDSGEGTFTDADQALLMKMVPTRKDHPEARKAKIEMIDSMVREKLAIKDEQGAPSLLAAPPKRVKVDYSGKVIK